MSKLGVILTSSLSLGGVAAAYVPRSSYPRRNDTYARADDLVAQLNSKLSPGESPRLPLDRITNLAQLFNFPQPPPPSAAGCVGVSQTFTSTGTFTSSCTGTLTMTLQGEGGANLGGSVYAGAGGGAVAKSALSVSTGDKFLFKIPQGKDPNRTTSNPSFACNIAVAACTTSLTVCSGVSLTSANFVCADNGRAPRSSGSLGGYGGTTANSLGVTLFKGGDGGATSSGQASGGGGGSAGPDGAGGAGTAGVTGTLGNGGAGDNGSGGAGGTRPGGNGVANVKGGGGGAGNSLPNPGGIGADPGGGAGGGYNYNVNAGHYQVGGRGQGIIQGDASDVLTPVLSGGSGYGGGTVGMA